MSSKSIKYKSLLVDEIKSYYKTENVLLVSSARSAICMILKTLPQKKVIVPAYTCEVVIYACILAGKELVYAHVDEKTMNINEYPEIDADTIVIATHQYGLPCEIKNLAVRCKNAGAVLIEDCAGSLGTRTDGQLTGTFGDFGVFSFSASKTLHSPTRGGFIIAKDAGALHRVKESNPLQPSDFLYRMKQTLKGVGFVICNSRIIAGWLDKLVDVNKPETESEYLNDPIYHRDFYEWQAYVVSRQFENLGEILRKRQNMFRQYDEGISNPLIQKPVYCEEAVNIRYPVFVQDREQFADYCRNHHVQVENGYKKVMCPESFVTAHKMSKGIVYLPFGSEYSEPEIIHVISVVDSYKQE